MKSSMYSFTSKLSQHKLQILGIEKVESPISRKSIVDSFESCLSEYSYYRFRSDCRKWKLFAQGQAVLVCDLLAVCVIARLCFDHACMRLLKITMTGQFREKVLNIMFQLTQRSALLKIGIYVCFLLDRVFSTR